MPLGYDAEPNITNLGDTADVYAYLYEQDDTPVAEGDLISVTWTIEKPDGTRDSEDGAITADGTGFLRYAGTDQVGEYTAVATFGLIEGQVRSVRTDFEVIDPFNPPSPTTDQVIAKLVWRYFEDCFDATDEGPWLRDMTLNVFNKDKIPQFIDEAVFDINQQNPPTDLTPDYFVHNGQTTPDTQLVVLGTVIAVILHLMRSYTEQAALTGAASAVPYHDRRDYVQRWQQIYELELQRYMRWVALWKRQFLGLGHSKVLISNKAGRLISAPMRTWMAGRGYR